MSSHVLLTASECQRLRAHDPDATNCPVCDWGLEVCKNCGKAEVELSDNAACSAISRSSGSPLQGWES